MPDDVYTDCPACGEKIPFYETVDEEPKQCPECFTDKEDLFDLADPPLGESMELAVADGGTDDV